MKKLLILVFCLMAGAGWAQNGPGRAQSPTNAVSAILTNVPFHALVQPGNAPVSQSAAAIAEAITPDIAALANNLGDDPTKIFNYVHDQIRYVHYFGSKKGAELTLLERGGNDFDQCSLLSALLQVAGYEPVYQFGLVVAPYDTNTFEDLHHWLGLAFPNTNWTATANYLNYFFGGRGFPLGAPLSSGDTNHYVFQHVTLSVAVGGVTYYLDPSVKISEPVSGINVTNVMALSSNALLTAAGGTDAGTYVTGLNEAQVRGALQNCNSNLLLYLSNNLPNASVAQVMGGEQIVSSVGSPLSASLIFPLYTNYNYPFLNWTNVPTNFMGTFSISLGGTNETWLTPQLEGQRVSLTFSNNGLARLYLEDSLVMQTTNTGVSNTVNVIFGSTHPYGGGWSITGNAPIDSGRFDQASTNAYQRTNSSYAILYAFDANPAMLLAREQKLDAYRASGFADSSFQVSTETLNVMGLNWMVQTELAHELLCQESGQLPESQNRFGRMGQESGRGYYVDVYLQEDGSFPSTGFGAPDIFLKNQEFDVSTYFWSAIEHGLIEQLQNSNLLGASTVKMLEFASTNSQKIYLTYSANWSSVESSLVGYNSMTLSQISALIGQGYVLMWIGGGYNGGFVSLPSATPSTPLISEIDANGPTYFNPQLPTFSLAGLTGADPVNLVDGSFQITSADLTLGGA